MVWVDVQSFDGLGQPKTTALTGGSWSTALVPLAAILLVAAVAPIAVRGWRLGLLAVIVAGVSAVMAYLAISLWVIRDVAVRAAHLAEVQVADLVGTQRHYGGAVLTLVAVGRRAGRCGAADAVGREAAAGGRPIRAPQIGTVAEGWRLDVRAGDLGRP